MASNEFNRNNKDSLSSPEFYLVFVATQVMGSPGKVVKTLGEGQVEALRMAAQTYVDNAKRFRTDLQPIDTSKL